MTEDRITKRYTIEFEMPQGGSRRIRACTPAGEPMAVMLATARLRMLDQDVRVSFVRIVDVETDWTPDPENDAIDHWNTA